MDGQQAAATLGVRRNATTDELRQAFRARAKLLHPDTGPAGSMERFIALRQAFELLMAEAPADAGRTATFETAAPAPQRRTATIDLTDAPRRLARRAPAVRRADEGRDARAHSFAEHLSAALARR